MKVKGLNEEYEVEIKEHKSDIYGEGILVTAGTILTGMVSVIISKEDWKKIKKEVK